ncbi:MAG: TonB-dependent receptor [Pseudomonadota bacterium]
MQLQRRNIYRNLGAATLFLSSALTSGLVFAQTDNVSSDFDDVIVITAQRREQDFKDVPISVTAFDAQKIQDYQIRNLEDYTSLAPNIGFASDGSPLNQTISIRGIADPGGTVATVSIFVDDFNTTASGFTSALDANLFDVERIEVLRGPQGTLFGRNVSGGAVSIVTKKPSDEFEGTVFGEYGSFDHYLVRGAVNVPMSDAVAVRVSAFTEGNDGFLENIGPSGQSNDLESWGARAAMRFTPSDTLTIDLAGSFSDIEQGVSDRVPTGVLSPFLRANGFPIDPLGSYSEIGFYPENEDTVVIDTPASREREITLITANAEKDFGGFSAIFTAGYMDVDSMFLDDADFTGGSFNVFGPDVNSGDTWSVEARLQSNESDSAFSWLVGVVYAEDSVEGSRTNTLLDGFTVGVFGFPVGTGPLVVEDIEFLTEVKSSAIFGDLTWQATARLSASFGIRFARDEVFESFKENEVVVPFFGPPGIVIPASALVSGETTSETITPRLSATYALTDEVNAYGTISRGARPGGSNLEAISDPDLPATYDEEIVMNYEAGLKGTLFDGSTTFSLAGFYLDWTDLQAESRVFSPGNIVGTNLTVSAGSVRTFGAELEFSSQLTDNFLIEGALGYQDAEFEEFNTVDELGSPFDASGNEVPFSSKFSGSFAAQYSQPVSASAEAFVRTEVAYRSSFWESPLNEDGAQPEVDGYETVNIRAGVDFGDVRVTVFGENLTNDGVNLGNQGGVGGLAGLLATVRPTRYGVNASFDF